MNYQQLIAEHDAIEAASAVVVSLCDRANPRPEVAARALEMLALLLRDHLAGEEDVIHQTVLEAQSGRHAATAERMRGELDVLVADWEGYIYRWHAPQIARNWGGFCGETTAMLGRIRERVAFETMVLYSLALHLDVVPVD